MVQSYISDASDHALAVRSEHTFEVIEKGLVDLEDLVDICEEGVGLVEGYKSIFLFAGKIAQGVCIVLSTKSALAGGK
jgi:hypothetical protein